jgi:hypothetical protein
MASRHGMAGSFGRTFEVPDLEGYMDYRISCVEMDLIRPDHVLRMHYFKRQIVHSERH